MPDLTTTRFLKLAYGTHPLDRTGFPWPYWMDLSVVGPTGRVAFAEGVAHGSAGGHFSTADALLPRWHDHVVRAGGEWLRPYVERLARGEHVTEHELATEYERRHGHAPESYDWDIRVSS